MKKLIVAAGCLLSAASALALMPSDYAKSIRLELADACAPANPVENFPALVRLSPDIAGFSYDDFRLAGGEDLAFVDDEGNELDYEIDTWNTAGESLVWVKVPQLRKGLVLTAYYGNGTAITRTPASVWNGYVGVWHCQEASGDLSDSTGHGHVAVPTGAPASSMVVNANGAVGAARYNQNNCTYYAGGAYIGGHIVPQGWTDDLGAGTAFTMSGWFKAQQVVGWMRAFSCKPTYNGNTGFEVEFEDDPRKLFFLTQGRSGFLAACPNAVGTWINVTFVVDGTSAACYTNGYLSASGTVPAVNWSSEDGLGLGVNANCTEAGFYGWIDEMRLKSGALGADEIAASYRTVADRGFFVCSSVRDVTSPIDVSGFAKSVTFTVGNGAPTVNASQVVLVRLSTSIEGFSYGDFTNDEGADMVFTGTDGCALAHEIDTWNPDGESLVWVRLDSCRPGDAFRLYYGQSGYVPAAASGTWRNYVGVWHFREESGTAYDSGVNRYHGTPSGARAERNVGVDGVVGKARNNGGNGSNGDADRAYLSLTSTTGLTLGTKFTVSGFFYVTAQGGWYRLVSRRTNNTGWGQELLWSDASTLYVYGARESTEVKIPTLDKQWVYLTLCYDDKTCAVYANGALVTVATLPSAPSDNGQAISFGNDAVGGDWSLFGNYDEIRISRGTPSAESIAADYATMMLADFLSAESAQSVDPSPLDCSQPVIRRAVSGGLEGVFTVRSGSGTFAADYGQGTVLPLSGVTDDPGEKVFAVSSLAAGESFLCTVVGTGAQGVTHRFASAESFYNGSLAVEKVSDADEMHKSAGVFRIVRGDTAEATRYALKVNYAFSGSAVAGVNYEGAATGSIEIPAGAAFVDLQVRPLVDAATSGDKSLTVTLTSGLYLAGDRDTTSMTIRKLPAPRKRNFAKRIELTIPAAFLGEEEVLYDFPVLVKLSTAIEGFDYADFTTEDGSDMIFADLQFVALPHSIDEWHADGTSLVWVCVPELRRNTKIYLYYGSADDIAGADAGRPWKNYVGVWHFNENAHTVAARDFSGNGLHAVPGASNYVSGSRDYEDGGQIGHARWNQPAVHTDYGRNWYEVQNYDGLAVGNTFLFSGWFKGGDRISGCPRLVSRKPEYNSVNGWDVELASVYTKLRARGVGEPSVEPDIPDLAAKWTHLAFQYTRTVVGRTNMLTVYADGEPCGTKEVGLGMDNGLPLVFGCDSDHNEASFFGAFDELRLRRGNDGASWVKAEYLTASDPDFVSYGAVGPAVTGLMLIFR